MIVKKKVGMEPENHIKKKNEKPVSNIGPGMDAGELVVRKFVEKNHGREDFIILNHSLFEKDESTGFTKLTKYLTVPFKGHTPFIQTISDSGFKEKFFDASKSLNSYLDDDTANMIRYYDTDERLEKAFNALAILGKPALLIAALDTFLDTVANWTGYSEKEEFYPENTRERVFVRMIQYMSTLMSIGVSYNSDKFPDYTSLLSEFHEYLSNVKVNPLTVQEFLKYPNSGSGEGLNPESLTHLMTLLFDTPSYADTDIIDDSRIIIFNSIAYGFSSFVKDFLYHRHGSANEVNWGNVNTVFEALFENINQDEVDRLTSIGPASWKMAFISLNDTVEKNDDLDIRYAMCENACDYIAWVDKIVIEADDSKSIGSDSSGQDMIMKLISFEFFRDMMDNNKQFSGNPVGVIFKIGSGILDWVYTACNGENEKIMKLFCNLYILLNYGFYISSFTRSENGDIITSAKTGDENSVERTVNLMDTNACSAMANGILELNLSVMTKGNLVF